MKSLFSKANQQRFILVTRKTRLQELIERFNTRGQACFYLEHNQIDTKEYLTEHDTYQQCLKEAEKILKPLGRFQLLERSLLPNYQFGSTDIVIVIGQDGLVANTLKYLQGQPVIAINPDPKRIDGKLLPFEIGDLNTALERTLNQTAGNKTITFAQAKTNDGQQLLAVNDLFIGPKTHTSARYALEWEGQREVQSSSGIIVSTGFGSSGWFRSILAGALGVTHQRKHELLEGFAWDDQRLQFTVREPFPSKTTGIKLVFGGITPHTPLRLESQMPENGVIFSDGIEADYVAFNSGTIVTVGVAQTQGCLVVS